jgi:hypothetical protein
MLASGKSGQSKEHPAGTVVVVIHAIGEQRQRVYDLGIRMLRPHHLANGLPIALVVDALLLH